MSIWLIDTSVFVELLRVPNMCQRHQEVLDVLERKIEAKEKLFLPMATIFETGNHIAQQGDGRERRASAERFVAQVRLALDGDSPFVPLNFVTRDHMVEWLDRFPDSSMRGSGLGDLSIIHDYELVCAQNPGRQVYIWAYDEHFAAYQG